MKKQQVLPVGVGEAQNSIDRVVLFPNPINQFAALSFDNQGSERFTLSVSEITGKTVTACQSTAGNTFVIEKNKLSRGIYFYPLRKEGTGNSFTGRFIAE